MNRFEDLIRAILWLGKRNWGLSFLLAFASFFALIGMGEKWPGSRIDGWFEGPVFRAGVYVGVIVFPNYAIRGTTGFYLVPLFGAVADFLILMVFWFIVAAGVRRLRGKKLDGNFHES
jgi:hypothetical protein